MKIIDVEAAVKLLDAGYLVGVPTETIYGLAADGLSDVAVERIFQAKGRPKANPLILHVSSEKMLSNLIKDESDKSRLLREKFWPGPLTLVYDKSEIVPDIVTAGLTTVCIRMPRQEQTLAVIEALGRPLAAPSANKSGRPSPTNLRDLEKEMPDLAVIDGGQAELGLESTVVDARGNGPVKVLRLGSLSVEDLVVALGEKVLMDHTIGNDSPGKQFKHYSPNAEVILVWPWEDFGKKYALEQKSAYATVEEAYADLYERYKCGIFCVNSREKLYLGYEVLPLGEEVTEQAKQLFATLHKTEELGWEKIIVDMTGIDTKESLSAAIVERLQRAAQN
jgi:L-threonylcarbamoyladenylate synthase